MIQRHTPQAPPWSEALDALGLTWEQTCLRWLRSPRIRTSAASLPWHLERGELLRAPRGASRPAAIQAALGQLWAKAQEASALRRSTWTRAQPPRASPAQARALDAASSMLSSMTSLYLDEGVSRWPMPGRLRGLFDATLALWLDGAGSELPALRPLLSDHERLRRWRAQGAAQTARELLPKDPERAKARIHQALQLLPGWAGMVHRLEHHPQERAQADHPIRLMDYLALALGLMIEPWPEPPSQAADSQERAHADALAIHETLRHHALSQAQPLDALGRALALPHEALRAIAAADALLSDEALARLLWLARERRHSQETLTALSQTPDQALRAPPCARPRVQAVFCIDDREESYRRHLEELAPDWETLGAAGFFGLPMRYQALDAAQPVELCPVGVQPTIQAQEHALDDQAPTRWRARRARHARLQAGVEALSLDPWGGALAALALAAPATAALTARVLWPRITARAGRAASGALASRPAARLSQPLASPQERAGLVAGLLRAMGIASRVAPMVLIVGHGSSSENNPHLAAYDCGACQGKHGGPNARQLAALANDPQVRQLLPTLGVTLPADAWFLGAEHDTSDDRVTLYDADLVPEALRPRLRQLEQTLARASALNALERCRRFASASHLRDPDAALRHVQGRATHLAQPRPELGHANNAVCVVGRRALTRGLFMDRRAFLVSYDPQTDPDASVLERLLAAAGPVCAGINLEYYFSRVDPLRYGSGTKLPHNMTGLLGVINGAGGDLRPGLPWQMVELHEPLRLLMVIEASPAALLGILSRQPTLDRLVRGSWIRVALRDPDDASWWVWQDQGLTPWTPDSPTPGADALPLVQTSAQWFVGHDEPLGFARVRAGSTSPPPQEVRS